jgi:hypothetical protein
MRAAPVQLVRRFDQIALDLFVVGLREDQNVVAESEDRGHTTQ